MQPLSVDGLRTEDDTVYILRDASAVQVSAGLEILDMDLNVQETVTDDLLGGSISRDSYATLHGSGSVLLTQALDWGQAIVRPYVVYTSDDVSVRFNLGAYFTNMPSYTTGETPITYTVQLVDILERLNVPVGDSVSYPAGTNVLALLPAIFTNLGFTQYTIAQNATSTTLATAKSWPIDDQTTWLTIVNELLSIVGYRGVYSDWDGVLRCDLYQTPAGRAAEWTYTDDPDTTMHDPDITVERDLYAAPNLWTAIKSNTVEDETPTSGNGLYIFQNDTVGPTSVEARDGRVIPKVMYFEAADQESLVSQATQTIEADMLIPTKYQLTTSPNPLHWHFDRVELSDGVVGDSVQAMSTNWTLGLDNSDMAHAWVSVGEQ